MRKKVLLTTFMLCLCTIFSTMRVEAAITPQSTVTQEESQTTVVTAMCTQLEDCEIDEIVILYYIVTGDEETVESISRKLAITEELLLYLNCDYKNPEDPFAKYAYVEIPKLYWKDVEGEVFYYVNPGDNLWNISKYLYKDISEMLELNPEIEDPNLIYVGDLIKIK